MQHTFVPSDWWGHVAPLSPAEMVTHLYLISTADLDGIAPLDSEEAAAAVFGDRSTLNRHTVVGCIRSLAANGYIGTYVEDGNSFAWIPDTFQPRRGALKRSRRSELPAPKKEVVQTTLMKLWGRKPSDKDCKSACPRAWGRRTAPKSRAQTISSPDVEAVWLAWRDRQARPNACRLGGARRLIENALSEASPDHLVLLIKYAYESDDPGPRFWRGENNRGRTYLGLNNLLVTSKLQERIQSCLEWIEQSKSTVRSDDGTNFGPLAQYKRRRHD